MIATYVMLCYVARWMQKQAHAASKPRALRSRQLPPQRRRLVSRGVPLLFQLRDRHPNADRAPLPSVQQLIGRVGRLKPRLAIAGCMG